ncbi:iron chelate uptake ABC transporter family permease subunit [Sodalis sp.]|uniref:iron chelate uptake ABC transporter family permease subunit n=1 Tax=Sodalis sp. (in: enterobacteria) TaxID=1898979 RepID=UPI003872C927
MGTEPSFEPQVLACRQRRRLSIPAQRLLLVLLALAFIGLFMTVNLHGNVRYILLHRAQILATLLLVAFAGGVATLLFQTVTHNCILTPSVMGLEALFILLQTATLFFVNVQGLSVLGAGGKFAVETLLLGFSWLLFRWLLGGVGINLHRVLLVGLVCGTLFRSLATLMQRLLSPGEFAILQSRLFATFTRASPAVLAAAAVIIVIVAALVWRMRHELDAIALGRHTALNLGIAYQPRVTVVLLVALLVAASTALVGPLTFFGLLVANLAYSLIGSWRHCYLLPGVVLLGVVMLVGGQLILERLLHMAGTLSVVIEFVGGALFLYLLIKKAAV